MEISENVMWKYLMNLNAYIQHVYVTSNLKGWSNVIRGYWSGDMPSVVLVLVDAHWILLYFGESFNGIYYVPSVFFFDPLGRGPDSYGEDVLNLFTKFRGQVISRRKFQNHPCTSGFWCLFFIKCKFGRDGSGNNNLIWKENRHANFSFSSRNAETLSC